MDLDVLIDRIRVTLLWTFFVVSAGYLLRLAYLESLKYQKPPEFMSGLLIYEDRLKCGLVRTHNMDRLACQLSGSICSELERYNQRKIRISAHPTECNRGNEVLCSQRGEFNESGFDPDRCYDGYSLVKVFPSQESSPSQ